MPETSDIPVTTARLTASLADVIHGPYSDAGTAAADLAAETARYLNYAAAKGGITDPATISAVTASLAIAAYRLPQLLNAISEWLRAETTAGRIADEHGPRKSKAGQGGRPWPPFGLRGVTVRSARRGSGVRPGCHARATTRPQQLGRNADERFR